MSKQTETMTQALEALESVQWMEQDAQFARKVHKIITALREALEKEALHKLATESLNDGLRLDDWDKIGCVNHDCDKCKAEPERKTYYGDRIILGQGDEPNIVIPEGMKDYTPQAQPAREWVRLTEEEKTELRRETNALPLLLMEAVEAKLREKNT